MRRGGKGGLGFVLFLSLLLSGALTGGSFDRNCVPCHQKEKVSLRKAFMNALLIYSGEKNMKAGLKYFLRHPSVETSVMGEEYFRNYSLMKPLKISDKELDEALTEYWERYKVIGNLQ